MGGVNSFPFQNVGFTVLVRIGRMENESNTISKLHKAKKYVISVRSNYAVKPDVYILRPLCFSPESSVNRKLSARRRESSDTS